MRQIADVHALALHHLLGVVEEGVDLRGYRLDFRRVGLAQALLLAALNAGDFTGQFKQRTQADAHLEEDGPQRAERKNDQGDRRQDGEALHILFHRRAILGGEKDERPRVDQ